MKSILPMFKAMTLLALTAFPSIAYADVATHPQAEAQALILAEKAIALRSVAGPGNMTADVARLFSRALLDGGYSKKDIQIVPANNTVYMTATWHGTDPSLKPFVILGHMDVVEAKSADWQRDPFTPVVEHGYLYGRGATDMKLDDTLAIAALLELRREGYRPKRTIILAFSGDEETDMRTGAALADKLSDAGMVLNVDGADGVLNEETGRPEYFSWGAAEKAYADYELTVTNPGGHSSHPRADNAIYELSAALLRVQKYQFKPEENAITHAYFENAAKLEPASLGAAMTAFAANTADQKAIATLSADPSMVGKIGTTCVATMVRAGHALNALPQRATANINCRIFPGHSKSDIQTELQKVVADPNVQIREVSAGSVSTNASPMDTSFTAAVTRAVHGVYPGLPVIPSMGVGASDNMWFRNHNVPSYKASPLFIKPSENFMHGLNERTPVSAIASGMDILLSIIPDLSN